MESSVVVNTEYQPINSCESDDSQSSISQSDQAPPVSDDSAEGLQSDSTACMDYLYPKSDVEDEASRQLLITSEQESPSPSLFNAHPLSLNFPSQNLISSSSSSSQLTEKSDTESNFDVKGYIPKYERLSLVDEKYVTDINHLFEKRMKVQMQEKCFIGDVFIDPKYKNAFYVHWNWKRIRQFFTFIHGSFLVALLFVGVGLLINMPRDGECDPYREWWQGSLSYNIFVPSFYDTDGDGFGDVAGIIDKLDYIENLGVNSVQLTGLFYDHKSEVLIPSDFSNHSIYYKNENDIKLLADSLHARDMHLIMNLDIVDEETAKWKADAVSSDLRKWIRLGADGFVFRGIEKLFANLNLKFAIKEWHNILNSEANKNIIMIAPLEFFENMSEICSINADELLEYFDMIEAYLNVSHQVSDIKTSMEKTMIWNAKPAHPWILWTMGGYGKPRIGQFDHGNLNLGGLIFQMFLPGSTAIYYGDEIGIGLNDKQSWTSLMPWNNDQPNGGFGDKSWKPPNSNWEQRNIASMNNSLAGLRDMANASLSKVPIYVNGIFNYNQDYQATFSPSYKLRQENNVLLVERVYPRREKYGLVINFSDQNQTSDFSRYYYYGKIIASSLGKTGDISFREIMLEPGEALAFSLDG